MDCFTKQEKAVILFLALTLSTGSVISYSLKRYPRLKDLINAIDAEALYPKVDINTASYEELIAVPYIGDYTANAIIERRKIRPFLSPDEAADLKGIRKENFDRFSLYLYAGGRK